MADSKHNSLQRDETPFRAIFERAAVGMAQVSLGGRFLLVNQGLCDFWGFSREELLERTFQQITHPDDLDLSVNLSKRLIAREIQTHTTSEKRYIHKDGHVVWGKITVALVRDSVSNEPRYFVSVIEDITQRKQAEQAWHVSEERFRFLVDNAPVLMWMSGLDKRCTFFNKPWVDFTGRSLESELGNGWAEGVHPDDLQRCVGTYTQAFDRREEFRMEYRLRRHDGEYRWIFDVGVPLFNEDRSFSGYIGSCVDITERKQAEAELEKHRQHLKEMVRERTKQLEAANTQLQSDIAVRRRAEDALRESESRFRALFENSPIAVLLTATDGRVLAANPAACVMFGMSEAEICLAGRDGLVDLSDPRYAAADKERQRAGRVVATEFNFRRANGDLFPAEVDSVILAGPPLQAFVILRDITERKRVEETLRLSEEKFARAFANNPAAVAMTRLEDGLFLEVNDTWEKLVGYSREEMIGQSARRMNIYPTPEAASRFVKELREKGSLRGWEQKLLKKSGEVFIAELSAEVLNFNGDTVILSTLVDITARKRAEEALRESESRFRAFFETEAVGTAEVDLNWRFVQVNQRFCRITGYSREELLGMTPEELTHPEDRDADRLYVQGRMPILDTDKRYIRKDGSVIWVHVTAAMIRDGEGKLLRSAGVVQDITERKLAEEALLRNEKLAATGRMAATIAHEINNPLAGATNALYLASTDPGLKPNTKEYLRIADEELRRATHITRQTLGFYRTSDSPTPIAFSKLIDELLGIYKTKLQSRNITVNRRYRCGPCAEGCEDCFYINPGELRQIISNLLVNGMDALRDNGTLYIRVSRVTNHNVGGKYIHLTIADNGCGIRVDHLRRIFEPFFTTKESFGTGLGLWVTQELVRKHNGVIKVRSRRDKGTVFRISFPAEQSVSRAA